MSPALPGDTPITSNQEAQETKSRLAGAKILLVEDSADNRALIKGILTREGAKVETANNGMKRVSAADAGFDDYLTKPVDRNLVIKTLARFISH